jgi:hypothetical protein
MALHFRPRARSIIATSVALMLLVSTVIGFLGWRLLSQEEALVRQQARDRLERAADQIVITFLRRLDNLETWLAEKGGLAGGHPPVAGGAVVVWFAKDRVDLAPSGRLLYFPGAPSASSS